MYPVRVNALSTIVDTFLTILSRSLIAGNGFMALLAYIFTTLVFVVIRCQLF